MRMTPLVPCLATLGVALGAGVLGGARLSVLDGVYSKAQAERGKAAYNEACAECHLEDLRGEEMAPGLVGTAFSFRWRDESLFALFDSLKTTMPLESPGSLGDDEYADVIAYMLEANGYPPGEADLPAGEAELEAIAIVKKP